MIEGLIGLKRGMTQYFNENGDVVPVTVVEVGPCPVVQVKTVDSDGYIGIQVGFGAITKKSVPKSQRAKFDKLATVAKALPGQDKSDVKPQRMLREFRPLENSKLPQVGQLLDVATVFDKVTKVKVTGISKGKGFQGVVRRHHFGGGKRSHGSCFHRRPGAIGCRAWPGRIHKGKRMAGHMGAEQVTVRNIELAKMDTDRNLLYLKGSVPGPIGAYVLIRREH